MTVTARAASSGRLFLIDVRLLALYAVLMRHGIGQLMDRLESNRASNISFDSESLIDEVAEAVGLYGNETFAAVWCDPKDNFVKDYYVIDMSEDLDDEERGDMSADKLSFAKNRDADDVYIITLSELIGALKYQDRIL